jgi:methionyl-tRNA synthetase
MSDKTFYVTTPIYYVNARPHIGHAYTTIVADVLARRHRLLGEDTFFLTGTDEHGQKIERSAAAAGIPPQQFADQISKSFEDLWHRMGITNNDYIRTTSDKHKRGVQHLFSELYKNGFIYLASYTGSYCVSDEAFVDAAVGTPCPDCGRLLEEVTEENFFFKLSAFQQPLLDLIESNEIVIRPDSARNEVLNFLIGTVRAVVDEYILNDPPIPISEAEDEDAIAQAEDSGLIGGLLWGVENKRLARTKSGTCYVPGALRDLSVSRSSFTWGIPVPEPAASEAAQKHVIYVWLDALANYMTALGYGSDDETLFKKFWPADLHLVGKEITRFHCVYWPAFLLAAELRLPKQITANGWLLFDNSKMSKSKGNIVRTETILDAFGNIVYASIFPNSTHAEQDLFASDVLRYYLLREIPFGQDGSFSFDTLITRYNADLANGYGNLVKRVLSMIDDNFAGSVPEAPKEKVLHDQIENGHGGFLLSTYDLRTIVIENERPYSEFLDICGFSVAISASMASITLTDRYISDHTPWKLAKAKDEKSQQKLREVLYTAAESIRIITALLYPILPYATARVWAQLGLGDIEADAKAGKLKNLTWGGLQPGTRLGPLGPIFPRADKGLAHIMTDMENPTPVDTNPTDPAAVAHTPTTDPAAAPRTTTLPEPATALPAGGSTALTTGPAPATPHPGPSTLSPEPSSQITIDDFAKIELRVAQILVAERIPKADKLLRLEVDLGPDFPRRQILSGIAEWYAPEDLIGRRIVVITNLAPRKMRGLESHGMLLAASHGENGKPVLATFGEDIALGSRLK